MKGNIIYSIVVAVILTAGYNVYSVFNNRELANLTLMNVEALANYETDKKGDKFVVSWTDEVSRSESNNQVTVTYRTTTNCPSGGTSECSSGSYTFTHTYPKGKN